MTERSRGGRAEAPSAPSTTFRPSDPKFDDWMAKVDALLKEVDESRGELEASAE